MAEQDPDEREFPVLSDLEEVASGKVPKSVWAYIQGGSGEERTLRNNRAAFRRRVLRPRVLVDVSEIRLSTRLLGESVSAPFYIAPMAYEREVHPDGELGVARAASSESVLAMYSTLSSFSLEEIGSASTAPHWFQLYLQPETTKTFELIDRAERAGYSALVVTVDCPILGVRDRQAREGFAIDERVPVGDGPGVVPPAREPRLQGGVYRLRADASATWEVVDEIRRATRLPIVIKGILTAEDTINAIEHGAKAVVVSNHGGRQLDGVAATLDALPEVVSASREKVEVYLDGGVRRGSDILLALALGAKAVGIGRPVLWALATGGGKGVEHYLALLKSDLVNAMALAGRRGMSEIDGSVVNANAPGRTDALD